MSLSASANLKYIGKSLIGTNLESMSNSTICSIAYWTYCSAASFPNYTIGASLWNTSSPSIASYFFDGKCYVAISQNDNTSVSITPETGKWIHVCVIFDKNDNPQADIYINGKELSPVSYFTKPSIGSINACRLYSNSNTSVSVAESGFWNRRLTPSEVTNLYENKYSVRLIPGLVSGWHLDDDILDLNRTAPFDLSIDDYHDFYLDSNHPSGIVNSLPASESSITVLKNLATEKGRVTRISIYSIASEVEWQFTPVQAEGWSRSFTIKTNSNGATTEYNNIYDSGLDYIDMWLPPWQIFRVRYREDGGEWSPYSTITYEKLNSFDKGRILSGLNPISSTITETSNGATVTNTGDNPCSNGTCINSAISACEDTESGADCST